MEKNDSSTAVQVPPNTAGGEAQTQTPDAKAPDAKVPEAKAPDAKAPDAKAPDAKAPDAKAPDAKAPDAKAPDAKAPDAKAPEPKPGEVVELKKEDLKLPEGSPLRAKSVDVVLALAKERKLDKAATQSLLDERSAIVAAHAAEELELLSAKQEEWYAASKADKEFGGEAYDANVEQIHRLLKATANPTVVGFLDKSKLYEHPEVLRWLHRLAQATKDASWHSAETGTHEGSRLPLSQRMYGTDGMGKPAEPAKS